MAEQGLKVVVGCEEFLKIVEELDSDPRLMGFFGDRVSEALIIAAEGGDIRIEEGGSVELSEKEVREFLKILGGLVKNNMPSSEEKSGGSERVRIRCEVLAKILRDLDKSLELQGLFGGPVCKALVVVADGGDLRVENGGAVVLSEKQSDEFSEILNRVIADNTG